MVVKAFDFFGLTVSLTSLSLIVGCQVVLHDNAASYKGIRTTLFLEIEDLDVLDLLVPLLFERGVVGLKIGDPMAENTDPDALNIRQNIGLD